MGHVCGTEWRFWPRSWSFREAPVQRMSQPGTPLAHAHRRSHSASRQPVEPVELIPQPSSTALCFQQYNICAVVGQWKVIDIKGKAVIPAREGEQGSTVAAWCPARSASLSSKPEADKGRRRRGVIPPAAPQRWLRGLHLPDVHSAGSS